MSISNIENEGPVVDKPEVSDNPLDEFRTDRDKTDRTTTSGESAATNTTDTKPTKADDSPKENTAVTPSAVASTKDEFLELLLNKIQPLGKSTTKLKMILYGNPDAGKTTLLSRIPNNLIIDAEDGTEAAKNPLIKEKLAENTNRLEYKTFEGLEKTVEAFHRNPEQLKSIRTISIDTISNLHKRGLAEVTEREWAKSPTLVNRYVSQTEHHTENNEHIRRLVQSLCDLDRNVILTAHARTIEPKDKPASTFPDFSEKLSNTLMGMMDVVGYMYQTEIDGEMHRVIKFHAGNGIIAKSRIGGFPANLVDPTWEKIEAILNG